MYKLLNGCNHEIHFSDKKNVEYSGVAFLDRDGVIIKEKNYIKDPNDVEVNPGIKEVIEFLNRLNYKIIIITNQSGIERKFFSWKEYLSVTEQMIYLLGESVQINSIYACGAINTEKCSWRKPGIGMIYQGWSKGLLETKNSILIGDKSSDIETGIKSNIRNLFHLLTGHGESEKDKVNQLIKDSGYINESRYLIDNSFFQEKNLSDLLTTLKKLIV